jgi:xanthine dehydrogenase FAD-binding subunit
MQRFEFFSARTVDEALDCLAEKGDRCRILAGGTDLLPALRSEQARPGCVLNILDIGAMREIRDEGPFLRVGSAATFTEMTESDLLVRWFPSLIEAAASVGGPQVRNRGTLGGNIANASPAADGLPAALALDGELELQSKRAGVRHLPLSAAITGPYRNAFEADELLTAVRFRKRDPACRMAFEKLGRRNAMARARMNLSIVVRQDRDGTVAELGIVAGAVMPVARRMGEAEKVLLGKKPEPSLIDASAEALGEEMVRVTGRRWSTNYKVPVLGNLYRRLLGRLIA